MTSVRLPAECKSATGSVCNFKFQLIQQMYIFPFPWVYESSQKKNIIPKAFPGAIAASPVSDIVLLVIFFTNSNERLNEGTWLTNIVRVSFADFFLPPWYRRLRRRPRASIENSRNPNKKKWSANCHRKWASSVVCAVQKFGDLLSVTRLRFLIVRTVLLYSRYL